MERKYFEVGEIAEIPSKYLNIFMPYLKEIKKKPGKKKKTGGD